MRLACDIVEKISVYMRLAAPSLHCITEYCITEYNWFKMTNLA